MSKETETTSAAPEKSYFSTVVSAASSGAAAVSGAAVVVGQLSARLYSSYNKKVEPPPPLAKAPKSLEQLREALQNDFKNYSSDKDVNHKFKNIPPYIGETDGGFNNIKSAAGIPKTIPKTKEEELALKKIQAKLEEMKAKQNPSPGPEPENLNPYANIDFGTKKKGRLFRYYA